jgi:hypothetical protein
MVVAAEGVHLSAEVASLPIKAIGWLANLFNAEG